MIKSLMGQLLSVCIQMLSSILPERRGAAQGAAAHISYKSVADKLCRSADMSNVYKIETCLFYTMPIYKTVPSLYIIDTKRDRDPISSERGESKVQSRHDARRARSISRLREKTLCGIFGTCQSEVQFIGPMYEIDPKHGYRRPAE